MTVSVISSRISFIKARSVTLSEGSWTLVYLHKKMQVIFYSFDFLTFDMDYSQRFFVFFEANILKLLLF